MAPATVEVDLRGDARTTAGELETRWGGERLKQVGYQIVYTINSIMVKCLYSM